MQASRTTVIPFGTVTMRSRPGSSWWLIVESVIELPLVFSPTASIAASLRAGSPDHGPFARTPPRTRTWRAATDRSGDRLANAVDQRARPDARTPTLDKRWA